MKKFLPGILSVNAGYVDTAGFLALQGLFSAHVTGNFVTLGAALVQGTSGIVAKLLALPMFCAVVILVRLAGGALTGGAGRLRVFLAVKVLLLCVAGGLAMRFGPFTDGDGAWALAAGMTLVAAMAVQNAVQRIHLSAFPPTTLMTGNTTQIMIDAADLLRGQPIGPIGTRLTRTALSVAGFALGCAGGAVLFSTIHMACFLVPPVIAILTVIVAAEEKT